MWFIIPVLSAVVLVGIIGFLIHCDWSPIVRLRYRNLGRKDGIRVSRVCGAGTRTDLTMSRRRFAYYLDGYQAALDYARWEEGITATRRSELDRVRRLDREIRQAHHELKEEA